MITLKVAGFAELERALRKLPEEVAGRVLNSALRKAGAPMADTARSLAPRSDDPGAKGHMADSIKLRALKVVSDHDVEVALWLGPDTGHFYGQFHEFGTVHQSARPFLRPAWDAHKDKALDVFGRELGAAIERAARKLAK